MRVFSIVCSLVVPSQASVDSYASSQDAFLVLSGDVTPRTVLSTPTLPSDDGFPSARIESMESVDLDHVRIDVRPSTSDEKQPLIRPTGATLTPCRAACLGTACASILLSGIVFILYKEEIFTS